MSRPPLPTVIIGDDTSVNRGTASIIIKGKTHIASERYPRAVDAFYGIPYARVPRRFQPAVPVWQPSGSAVSERINASKANAQANNQPTFTAATAEAERTLTLNIFRPSLQSTTSSAAAGGDEGGAKLLPVVVYVHGGGFNFGEPLERDHVAHVSWASHAAAPQTGILIVSICYRLGALGFLAGTEEEEKGQGQRQRRALNLGLKDQRVAMEWVQVHIGAFGGDAANVTLMGMSAGAHSIGHHILDPRNLHQQSGGTRLFQKAILESGSATARSVLSAGHPRMQAHADGLREQTAMFGAGGTLETMDVAALLQASVMVWADHQAAVTWPFQPVVEDSTTNASGNDGDAAVIPYTPLRLWDQFADKIVDACRTDTDTPPQNIAIITGFCSHEGTSFVPSRASTNADFRAFFATLIPSFSASDLDELERLYPDPVTDPTSPYKNNESTCRGKGAQFTRLHEAYAHYGYICPVLHTAHKISTIADRVAATMGEEEKKPVIKIYLYEYAALSGDNPPAAAHGAHASIVAHDTLQLHGRPGLSKVAEAMHARWTAFAAARDGCLGEEVWPEFKTPFTMTGRTYWEKTAGEEEEEGRGKLLVFGKGNDEQVRGGTRSPGVAVQERVLTEREHAQCRFWWIGMGKSQGKGSGEWKFLG